MMLKAKTSDRIRSGRLAKAKGDEAGSSAPTTAASPRKPRIRAVPEAARPRYRGSQLATAFLDQNGHVSVDRAAEHFGISKGQLAETIGLKREALYRAARTGAPKTQARALEMLEIVGRVVDWAGSEKQALAWYRAEPIAPFGGRTAEALVKEGKAAAVRNYLDHVATGSFA